MRAASEIVLVALTHPETNRLTERIIGAACKVHSGLNGPGLREVVYEECLYWELVDLDMKVDRQRLVPIVYRSRVIPAAFRADLVVDDIVILEVKSVEKILPLHKCQLLTYLRLAQLPVGLLMNFNVERMIHGITRISL